MVTDKPLVLTTLLVYSTVISVPLGNFPPTDVPTVSDVLIFSALILLTLRVVQTFNFSATSNTYPAALFVLEVGISFLFAGQFGVAIAAKLDPEKSLWLFYAFHLALIMTMPLWGKLANLPTPVETPKSVKWMRSLGVVFSCLGIVIEVVASKSGFVSLAHWIPALGLLALAIWYGRTRKWTEIE